jgi:hypothetical protein
MLTLVVPVTERDAVAVGCLGSHTLVAGVIDVSGNNPPIAETVPIGCAGAAPEPLLE